MVKIINIIDKDKYDCLKYFKHIKISKNAAIVFETKDKLKFKVEDIWVSLKTLIFSPFILVYQILYLMYLCLPKIIIKRKGSE